MIDFKYLYQGVCGLANAHPLGTMAGHLGAAVATGYFVGEDQADIPAQVARGIEAELDRIIAGEEAIWFDVKKTGMTPTDLFRKFPSEPSHPETIQSIVDALETNVGQLRQSGHNVIFGSIAVRALLGHPQYATPSIVKGIRKLMERFDPVNSGRGYYGKSKGWLVGAQVENDVQNFPAYRSIQEMVNVTIDELIASAAIRKRGFGGLWHIINHAAGITELERLGFQAVAKKCLAAHHQHIRLWRSLPDVEQELGAVVKSAHGPLEADYWKEDLKRSEALLTHRIKTLYGYYTIRRFLDDAEKKNLADDALLYLMD